eukprot:COSAG02_NODE_1952_length_10284_cov_6.837997_3_plen_94_part_00
MTEFRGRRSRLNPDVEIQLSCSVIDGLYVTIYHTSTSSVSAISLSNVPDSDSVPYVRLRIGLHFPVGFQDADNTRIPQGGPCCCKVPFWTFPR